MTLFTSDDFARYRYSEAGPLNTPHPRFFEACYDMAFRKMSSLAG